MRRAVLFDLDGTLIDTAPDMAGALAEVCLRHGEPAPDYAAARAMVANGGAGLVRLGFPDLDQRRRAELLEEFLATYEARIARASRLFEGLTDVLDDIERADVPWGIVTNKPERLSALLLDALELTSRSACLIGGDTLAQRKPHPAPLLAGAAAMNRQPADCLYLGDNARDIEAGAAAGMLTVAVSWGYLLPGDSPDDWGADHVIDDPADIPALAGISEVLQIC